MKKLKAEFRINSFTGDPLHHGVTVSFRDETSHVQFLEATLTFEELGKALMGSGGECEFELRPEHVGKIYQTKTVQVLIPGDIHHNDDAIRKAISEFEVDGWEGRDDDAKNPHNWKGKQGDLKVVNVVYRRYVEAE